MPTKLLSTTLAAVAFLTTVPAFAQDYPSVTVLRTETIHRQPGRNPPVGQVQKGASVVLFECTDTGAHCRILSRTNGRRIIGWIAADALDGVVSTK